MHQNARVRREYGVLTQIKSCGDAAVLFRTNSQVQAIEQSLKALNISCQVLGAAALRRPPLPVRELAGYVRAILNPDDGANLLQVISLPISVPHRGAPSIGDRTRAKIREWANASNMTIFAALSKIELAVPANQSSSRVRILSTPESESALNNDLSKVENQNSEIKSEAKEIIFTARQAVALSASIRIFKQLRSSADGGLSVPDLISAVLDRAGFRTRFNHFPVAHHLNTQMFPFLPFGCLACHGHHILRLIRYGFALESLHKSAGKYRNSTGLQVCISNSRSCFFESAICAYPALPSVPTCDSLQ